MLRENALRVGRTLTLAVADAMRPPIREADVVLLDVPCTGTGTLARHPDARWRLTSGSIDELVRVQSDMLAAAADVVRPGGLLVYSTCTLEPEENAEQVHAFLRARPDFEVEASDVAPADFLGPEGFLEMTPQAQGFDGAFAARLRRAA